MLRASLSVTLTLAVLAPLAGRAAEARDVGLEAYLSAVDEAEAGLAAACNAAEGAEPPAGRVWLRLGPNGLEIAPADATGAEAAAFWAEMALGAKRAAAQLYGDAAGAGLAATPVMIETGDSGVAVHDGKAMRLGDVCDALERMVAAMGDGAEGDPFDAARGAVNSTERLALAVGGRAETALSAAPPAGAVARGPDGVAAEIVETADGARLVLEASGDAAPGEAVTRIYAPDDPFRPVETVEILVLPGAAAPEASTGGALALGHEIEGLVAEGGSAELTIDIDAEQSVRFASSGATDVAATLVSESGAVVAADDDSGEGYGFAFSATLTPGRYTLKLQHCCGGGGRFAVTATSK